MGLTKGPSEEGEGRAKTDEIGWWEGAGPCPQAPEVRSSPEGDTPMCCAELGGGRQRPHWGGRVLCGPSDFWTRTGSADAALWVLLGDPGQWVLVMSAMVSRAPRGEPPVISAPRGSLRLSHSWGDVTLPALAGRDLCSETGECGCP